MKQLLISAIAAWIGLTMVLAPSFADTQGKNVITADDPAPKTSKRRKRVLMCKECGKPETQCECEGEGHRTPEAMGHGGHDDHDDHDHAHDSKQPRKKSR